MTDHHDQEIAAGGRKVAIVIAASGVLSILAPEIIATVQAAPKYEILLYLISMAGFIWSLVATWNLWQKRRK